jgi:aminoglycoside phosphotransferase (APT) family kinase protein
VPINGCDEASLVELLGTDLLALIRARGVPITKLSAITGLPSPVRKRAAFAVEFADGTKLKARRFKSVQRADTVVRLRGAIGAGFAAILARRGDGMLLEWVEGRSLASLESIACDLLRRCGQMLGAMHRLPCETLPEAAPAKPAELFAKLERDADLVVSSQLLDPEIARRALADADANRPGEPTLGIIHKDFCAENIVLDASGAPVSIDNGTVSFGPLDLDLARTWYRWPMTPADREHLLRGYAEYRSHASFMEHFSFWAIAVLVASASSRLRLRVGRHREPLERLRTLLDSLDRHDLDPLRWAV